MQKHSHSIENIIFGFRYIRNAPILITHLLVLESEALTAFFDEVLDRWDEIRSVKGYVAASLRNMTKG